MVHGDGKVIFTLVPPTINSPSYCAWATHTFVSITRKYKAYNPVTEVLDTAWTTDNSNTGLIPSAACKAANPTPPHQPCLQYDLSDNINRIQTVDFEVTSALIGQGKSLNQP